MAPIDEQEAAAYRAQFPIFAHTNYLNSCSLGPLSVASRNALLQYVHDWANFGAPAWWRAWLPRIDHIKTLFADLIHATPDSVTISHSVSSALTSVASTIDYSQRNKVVVTELDFPTIAYQWLVKPGVEVVFARSTDGITVPLEEYERLIDGRTALVATSHVFYATGAVQDIRTIAAIAHRHGALALADGYHAVGVLPVDVQCLEIDFYLGGTLKWLLGGPGLTFIYVAPHLLPDLRPTATGWFASAEQFAFNTLMFTAAAGADRLQLGTPAIATVYSGIPALEMIREVNPMRIYARVQHLTRRIISAAQAAGYRVASPLRDEERGGIVMLHLPAPQHTVEELSRRNIVVDYRPGKVRFSPHFYNIEADIDAAMMALVEIQNKIGAVPKFV
jgi:kynureninase